MLGRWRSFNALAAWSMRKRLGGRAPARDENGSVATRLKQEWKLHNLASLLRY
jgi:hypothetical protein